MQIPLSPQKCTLAHRSKYETLPVTCKLCNVTVKNHIHLNRHNIVHHSDDKKYECKYCGKRLPSVYEVRSHEITHQEPQGLNSMAHIRL